LYAFSKLHFSVNTNFHFSPLLCKSSQICFLTGNISFSTEVKGQIGLNIGLWKKNFRKGKTPSFGSMQTKNYLV